MALMDSYLSQMHPNYQSHNLFFGMEFQCLQIRDICEFHSHLHVVEVDKEVPVQRLEPKIHRVLVEIGNHLLRLMLGLFDIVVEVIGMRCLV
jgi:hypothetical protein